ncbi:ATP-binding protein [Streptomyces sp. NPDC001292]|uniref:ATP-binding protein n=1 Tax=Streptomyces sp. NPDC001292 TaxID=3364558 RepID=UPI0036C70E20
MPASSPPRRASNLPSELTSFVGRRREVAEIKRLLTESRLVTLTGVGGAGKTRLSLRVAADLHRAFPDGVWLVELAALEDHALLSQTIASTLGILDRTARWPAPALADFLSTKQMLLVLDNCEHLRDACAVLADTVLRAAPGLRILTTSRQALGLTGEHIFHVPTLSVPEGDRLPPLEALGHYEAVNLFLARATAVQPAFALTEDNYKAVVKVCRQLDGLPLAIELTAVRLRALSVEEILQRLEHRYRLLTAGNPGALPRHQTLRALIDWSNDLCSEQERTLWAQLSVFSGGFDLAAVEAICAGGDIDDIILLDVLAALVDKSLVIAEEQDGRVRYHMLETIRQYGQERLAESADESAVQRRHRDHFAALVDQACAEWCGPDQQRLLSQVLREHNNIRGALEFALSEPGAESGLRMAGALWFFWIATGLTGEGRRWLERLLERDVTAGRARARALWVCAYLCIIQEDIPSAEPMIQECRRQADQIGDAGAAAWAVQLVGMVAMSLGELTKARTHLETGLEQHRACGDDLGFLDTCFYLVAVTALLGEPHRAAQLCEEALALCDSRCEQWLKSYMLWDLGLVAWQLGDSQRAAASGREGLRLAREFNEQWAIAFCIEILAWTTHAELKHRFAAQLLGCADSIWRRIGAPLFGIHHLLRYHEQCHEGVRTALGSRFDAEYRSGIDMGLERAIALALGEPDPQQGHVTSGAQATAALTPRELEVARLIAEGLSNKAIAAKLVIARRTAEAHVEHILGKLGFSSRAQVAAWVAEARPAENDPAARC